MRIYEEIVEDLRRNGLDGMEEESGASIREYREVAKGAGRLKEER